MKKWLVGLLAASLCAASALAEGVATLPVNESYSAQQDWTKLTGFSGGGKLSTYKDGGCGFSADGNWLMVQFDSAPAQLSFDIYGNSTTAGTAPGSFLVEESADGENWNQLDNFDNTEIAGKPAVTHTYDLSSDSRYVRWTMEQRYLWNVNLNNVKITAPDGPVAFGVTLDPAEDFTVVQGTEGKTITATVKGAVGDVVYAWSVNDTSIDLAGNVYTIDASEVGGPYVVVCEALDEAAEDPVSASVSYSVVEAPVVTGDEFALVSSVDGLADGTKVVLTDPDGTVALVANVANSVFTTAAVAPVNDVITTEDATIIWTLKDDGNGNFSLYNEGVEKYTGHSGTSNAGRLQTNQYPHAISVADADASLCLLAATTADGSGAYRDLQYNYNNGSPRFAYYKGTQKNLRIYAAESGPAALTVTFDKADGFTVEYGSADSITATAKNGEGECTFAWSSETPDLNGSGATLAIPNTLEAGDYSVTVTVTDSGEGEAQQSVEKSISFSVVAPAQTFTVSVYDGIQHGTVELSVDGGDAVPGPVEVAAGTSVKVIATPESRSYKVGEIIVTDEDGAPVTVADDGTFTMPESDVYVTATFEEVVIGTDQYVKISTTAALEEGEYVITGAKAGEGESEYAMLSEIAGTSTKYIPRDANAVEVVDGVITGPDASIVWTLEQGEHGWTIFNAAETAGYVGYVKTGNSAGYETNATEKSSWTITANDDGLFAVVNVADGTRTLRYNSNSGQERFACYANETGVLLSFYKKETGPAEFSVTFDKENGFTVELGSSASITATAKNGEEPYSYVWSSDTPELGGSGATLNIPDTLEAGDYTVQVEVTDAAQNRVDKQIGFSVVAPAPTFAVNVAVGIQNGRVSTDVSEAAEGDTVTVTATPDAGYQLVEIIVNNGDVAVTGNTFVMPAGDVLVTATFEEKPPVTGDEFALISSVDGLADGTKVVLTDPDGTVALVANVANNAFTTTAVEPVNDVITTEDATIIWTLKDDGNGNFSLYNEGAEKYTGHSGTSNSGRLQADPYPHAISVAGADASLFLLAATTADGSGAYRDLQYNYNNGSPRFAYYKGTQKNLRIYAAESGPAQFAVTFDKEDGFTVAFETADSITATAKNGSGDYSYTWTGDLTGEGATLAIPATLAAGDYTVKVTVTDNGADEQTVEKSISFSVVAPGTGDEFALISSVDGLADGTKVVLTDPDGTVALVANVANNVFTTTAVAPVNDVITTDDATIIWTLKDDGNGNFSLYNEGAEKYTGHSGTSNAGRLQADPYPHAISVADADASLFLLAATTADGSGAYRDLQYNYNSGNPRFAYYKGTQKNLRIYAAESGPAEFTVTFDKEDGFTVELETADSITATAKNGSGDYTYAWTGDLTGEGATLTIPATLATGDYTVKVTVTDNGADEQTVEKSISFSVVAPAQTFAVNVAVGIQNGRVSTDVSEAAAGDTVTVTATPDAGYQLVEIIVNNGDVAVSGNTFVMPASDVLVTATFEEKPPVTGDEFALISSVDGLAAGTKVVLTDPDGTVALVANVASSVFTTAAVEPVNDVITTDDATIIWTLKDDGNGNFSLYNEGAEKYAGHGGGASSNSGRLQADPFPNAISVADAEASLFLIAATTADGGGAYRDLQYNYNNGNPRFAYYKGTQKNLRIYAAANGPTITFTGDTTVQLPDGAFRLTFTLANYDGDFEWVVDSREGGAIDQDGVYTWAPTEAGEVTIKVVARNSELDIASKEVALTVEAAPGPQPGEFSLVVGGDTTGVVGSEVNFTVTPENATGEVFWEIDLEGTTVPTGSSLDPETDVDWDLPNASFTPDAEGEYVFKLNAEDEGGATATATVTITVTGEGPGPQPTAFEIKSITKSGNNLVLTFEGEGEAAVYGTATLNPQDWTVIEGAEISGTTVTVPMGDQKFIRIDAR